MQRSTAVVTIDVGKPTTNKQYLYRYVMKTWIAQLFSIPAFSTLGFSTLAFSILAFLMMATTTMAEPLVYEGSEGIGKGKHIVFIANDHEYRSGTELSADGKDPCQTSRV